MQRVGIIVYSIFIYEVRKLVVEEQNLKRKEEVYENF